MKPRKDQTDDQRIMREMGGLLLRHMQDGEDKTKLLRKLWWMCPHGYKDFTSFYKATYRLAAKNFNS